jgi:hypothetical protein
MVKPQFLLLPDGSVPPGTNVEAINAAGIPMVRPTPQWRPAEGMVLEERDAEQDADGVWHQVWVEVPAPPPPDVPAEPSDPAPDPFANLTIEQKQVLWDLLQRMQPPSGGQ